MDRTVITFSNVTGKLRCSPASSSRSSEWDAHANNAVRQQTSTRIYLADNLAAVIESRFQRGGVLMSTTPSGEQQGQPVLRPAPESTNAILTAMGNQVASYERLAKLAELQHEHVQQSRTKELVVTFDEEQQVLDQVAELEQTIAPAKAHWKTFLSSLSREQRAVAESWLARSRALLEALTSVARTDALLIQHRERNLSRQIRRSKDARDRFR